jgi:hypothetical protein
MAALRLRHRRKLRPLSVDQESDANRTAIGRLSLTGLAACNELYRSLKQRQILLVVGSMSAPIEY